MRTLRVLAAASLATFALTGLAPAAMAGPAPGLAGRVDCTPPAISVPGIKSVAPFSIVGVVLNGADQTPVVGAPVTLVDGQNTQHVTKTLDCGYFVFRSDPQQKDFVAPGLETVTVNADGFEPLTQAAEIPERQQELWQFLLQALPVQTSASPTPAPQPPPPDHRRLILIAGTAGGGGLLLLVPTVLLLRRARRRSSPDHAPAVAEQLSVVTRAGGALVPAVRPSGPDFQFSVQPRMQPGVPQVTEGPR